MKTILYFIILTLVSCVRATEKQYHSEPVEIIHQSQPQKDLSKVVASLLDQTVEGYVLIHYKTTEYSLLEKARSDQSPSKSIVKLDTEQLQLHMPLSVKDSLRYNWGSPLIFRKVIKDHGDVVEVNTTDVDLLEPMGHGGRGADYLYDVVTFVRKKDLVPVLSKPCQKSFENHTRIKLYPGVAVGIPWDGDLTQRALSVQLLDPSLLWLLKEKTGVMSCLSFYLMNVCALK